MAWAPQSTQFQGHVTLVSAGFSNQSPGSVGAGATVTFTIAVPGCLVSDDVQLFADAPFGNALTMTGEVSAAGTVTVKIHNVTAGALSAPSTNYRAVTYRYDPKIFL